MGIESEQLVYDYLSRVSDLAAAAPALSSADRARLVNDLRRTIDSRRSKSTGRSARAEVGAVRRILAGLGSPDEVVRRASHGGMPASPGSTPGYSGPSVPSGPSAPSVRSAPSVPAQGTAPQIENRAEFVSADAGRTAHGADFWTLADDGRVSDSVYAADGASEAMLRPPGWTGGFERDFLRPDRSALVDAVTGIPKEAPAAATPAPAEPKPGLLRRILAPRPAPAQPEAPAAPAPAAVPRASLPLVETLATLVLVGAAVSGLWYVALLGWLFAYGGRRLGRGATRFASLWIPGLMAAVCGFWLYSRAGHAPGGHLSSAQATAATHAAFQLWLRGGAGLSAAFLAWRISRR